MRTCYLCGDELKKGINRTIDHVPPKSIFPSGVDQFTVYCCLTCNQEYDELDEIIKHRLSFLSVNVPEEVRQSTLRALSYHDEDGKLKSESELRIAASKFERLNHEEILIDGKRNFIIKFEDDLMNKWLVRIVKAFYYDLNKSRIPDSTEFKSIQHFDFPGLPNVLRESLTEHGKCFIPHHFPKGVLHKDCDSWFFVFYQKIAFETMIFFK